MMITLAEVEKNLSPPSASGTFLICQSALEGREEPPDAGARELGPVLAR